MHDIEKYRREAERVEQNQGTEEPKYSPIVLYYSPEDSWAAHIASDYGEERGFKVLGCGGPFEAIERLMRLAMSYECWEELAAAKLLEEYAATRKAGSQCSVEDLVNRCPVGQREGLLMAIAGHDFIAQNHPDLLVSDELIDRTIRLIQASRRSEDATDETADL